MRSASTLLRLVCVLLTIALWAVTVTSGPTLSSIAAAAALTAIVVLFTILTWEENEKPQLVGRRERSRITAMVIRTAVRWGPIISGALFIIIALVAALGSFRN
jgi:hypothetical protein